MSSIHINGNARDWSCRQRKARAVVVGPAFITRILKRFALLQLLMIVALTISVRGRYTYDGDSFGGRPAPE